MRDGDIRRQLRGDLARAHGDDPDTLIVDELGLIASGARVDLAVINGSLHAYEIKSAADTLARLPGQAKAYSAAFDAVTIVAASRHVEKLAAAVPDWWEIVESSAGADGGVILTQIRAGAANASVDGYAVAQLLWRDEALVVLTARGLDRGLRNKPRRTLWRALADGVPVDELGQVVRDALRAREQWRPAAGRTSDDASSQPTATCSDCPA
jgi:hypothetical protein